MHRIPRLMEENDLVGAAIVTPTGGFHVVNDRLCELFGYSREKLLSKTFQEISHPDDITPEVNPFRTLIESKGSIESMTLKKRYKHGVTGEWVRCLLKAQGLFDDEGNFLYFLSRIVPTHELTTAEDRKLEKIKSAIQQDFVLHYQPIVRLGSKEIQGYEALSRWKDGSKLIMPGEFLPLLRKGRCEHLLCHWVIEQVTAQQKKQEKWLSFNISPLTVARDDFIDQVLPTNGHLEILESELVSREVTRKLQEARSRGIKITLDDFGTGYCSYERLLGGEIDLVKIDRSIIERLPGDSATVMIKAVTAMANELNIAVIAEGVEKAEQVEALLELGVEMGQGYLFGKAGELVG
ncbi:MAG: EAL domain-containing protein [Cyanobacteria bacterium P01_F01_bin.13]